MKCGARLPEDEAARFCPVCGASLGAQQLHFERRFEMRRKPRKVLWAVTLRNRFLAVLLAFVLCLMITAAGAVSKVERQEADEIVEEFDKLEELLSVAGLQFIFGNNLMYCVIMFVPVLGPYYGSYVLYSTGRVLAAFGLASGYNPLELFFSLFFYPHAWLEYVSYSLALSESFWLIYAMIRHREYSLRNELSTAAKIMAICVVLLLLAAVAEMSLITSG
ncbi:zinc ribbon domain-containing protein [Candidatus Bathyarchaeota archaeon]|nr:zinc ribbon domain-containing protein [Candidatus Bathyarchaeota archaeon]